VPDPRGHPLHVVVWLHQPGAPPDFAMNGEDPQPVPRPRGKLSHLDIARKLLEKGANPNVTITWGDHPPSGLRSSALRQPTISPSGGLLSERRMA
jgi:hypothetical protein